MSRAEKKNDMEEEKVSSEKDIDEVVKKPKRKKKTEEVKAVEPEVVKEEEKSELELLREQIRLLQEANEAAQKENKRLLELSARVLDASADTKEKEVSPGKLYSLSKLEGVLGKKFKMSINDTLATVQTLYEAGYVNNGLMTMPAMALILVGIIIWIHRSRNKDLCEK